MVWNGVLMYQMSMSDLNALAVARRLGRVIFSRNPHFFSIEFSFYLHISFSQLIFHHVENVFRIESFRLIHWIIFRFRFI